MIGTIRTLDYDMQKLINRRMQRNGPPRCQAYGGDATIEITQQYRITYNASWFVVQMLATTLERVDWEKQGTNPKSVMALKIFSYFQKVLPFLFLLKEEWTQEHPTFPTPYPWF